MRGLSLNPHVHISSSFASHLNHGNHRAPNLGLATTIQTVYMYGMFGRKTTKYTVLYGVYTRYTFLYNVYTRYTVLFNPNHIIFLFCAQALLAGVNGVMHFFGRLSFLVDENAHALHFFISALLQVCVWEGGWIWVCVRTLICVHLRVCMYVCMFCMNV